MKIAIKENIENRTVMLMENPNIILPLARQSSEGQAFLKSIHRIRHLSCMCCNPGVVMFARLSHGKYTLVNHHELGHHDKSCPLWTDLGHQSDDLSKVKLHNAFKNESIFDSVTKTTSSSACSLSTKKAPLIERVARYLLRRSGMTTWANRQGKSIEEKFRTMLGVAEGIEFGDSTLSEYLFFGKQGIEMAIEKLIEVENDWPANSGRPHALVFMVLNDYQVQNSESVFLSNEEGAVTLSFHSLIIPKESFEGEAVVMLSIARHEKTSEYMPHTIWLHPVLSTDVPLLTRTRTEKAVTKGLIATSKSREHNFFITKPVTQISDSDADLVLGIVNDDGVKTRILIVLSEEENDQRISLVKEANSRTKVIALDTGKGIVYKDVWKELERYAGVTEMFV